ncbi:MAG: alpha/beta hydrolase [Hyphomicrobium sp.]
MLRSKDIFRTFSNGPKQTPKGASEQAAARLVKSGVMRPAALMALLALVPAAGLLAACGQEDALKRDRAEETNSRGGESAGSPAPSEPESTAEGAPESAPAGKPDSENDGFGAGRADNKPSTGTREYRSEEAETEAASPPPPPPPRAEVPPPPSQPPPAPAKRAAPPGEGSAGAEQPKSFGGDDSPVDRGIGSAAPPRPSAAREAAPPAGGAAAPAVKEPFDVVQVFYGTDRAVEANPKRLAFGAERGHKLQLGRAFVTVPSVHKVPNIERPWVIELPYFKYKIYEQKEDPALHFTLQDIGALTKEQMLAHVREKLAKSATFKDHAFVFVHGFNTSFDYALYRTAQISYDLKFDGAPFVYSWPSGGKVASYTYDRGSAEQAEPHLAQFIDIVVKESGAKSVSLIAHSMGNELLLRVLERMGPVTPQGVVISQVILAAPDVDRDKFRNIASHLSRFAKGVTLYAASNDKALGYSARFWGGVPRAGDVPEDGPLVIKDVDTIDVTEISTDGLGLNHSGYAENNALLNDIKSLILTGQRPPDLREPKAQKLLTAAGMYWKYPPMPPAAAAPVTTSSPR